MPAQPAAGLHKLHAPEPDRADAELPPDQVVEANAARDDVAAA
jgi:hypothetical protein